ncbi:hypothetical protein Fcan01_16923 [Folsomia candida]|uniref:Uncharacterized protein n=1 Tax=Folsomia candida TaxID=158441 RepID=A0A226DRH9_FOLCA|nr:hypothetical protein Fcan01_16923 [Folsomia candida]
MGRRRLFQLSARQKRRLVKRRSEIFEENLNSDLVQAEGENIYLEQVFEEDLEEIEVGSNTSEGSSTETISSESEDAVAAHPRTPNFPDEGTVDEEIQKSLKNVADRVGKRMRNRYELLHIHRIQDEIAKTYRRNRYTILHRFSVESADISLRYLLEFISKVGNSMRIRYRYQSECNIET